MKYSLLFLTAIIGLLATGCSNACDYGWGDTNSQQKAHLYASVDPTAHGDPLSVGATEVLELTCTEVPETGRTDVITNCKFMKKNIGDDMDLCLSTSADFKFNLMENSFFSNGCARITTQEGDFDISVGVDTPVYAYIRFKNGVRTGIQRVRFYNEEVESDVAMQCDGEYRIAETTLIAESTTSLAADVEGVMMTRYNDRSTCVLQNTNANSVHVSINKEGDEVPSVEIELLGSNEIDEVPCTFVDASTYEIKVWHNDIDTDLKKIKNSFNEEYPTAYMKFVWDSNLPMVSLTTVATYETQQFEIDTADAAGIACAISVDNSGDVMAELTCENTSSTDVEINLVRMKSNDVTDGTYIEDFDVVKFSLGNTGGVTDTDSASFDMHSGCYAVKVIEEVAFFNTNTIGHAGFCVGRDPDAWVFEMLDESAVIVE